MPAIAFIVGICFLIAIHDLSTAVILFATSFILLFIGRVHLLQLFSVAALMLLVAVLFIFFLKNTPDTNLESAGRLLTWKHRIEGYSNPSEKAMDMYQVRQAEIAIARGEFFPTVRVTQNRKTFYRIPTQIISMQSSLKSMVC